MVSVLYTLKMIERFFSADLYATKFSRNLHLSLRTIEKPVAEYIECRTLQ